MSALAALSCVLFPQCTPFQEAKLLAAGGGDYDLFGGAVALDGDLALVGARQDGPEFEGSAYVFERGPTGWAQVAKLSAPDAAPEQRFGYAVALSSDWIAVGAPNDGDHGAFSGSVYLYQRRGGAWNFAQELHAADASPDDAFGAAVALHGDLLVAGADCADPLGFLSGAAYVFERSGNAWLQVAKLSASDGEPLDAFGFSVAVHGCEIAVGAYGEDSAADNAGATYVFRGGADVWAEVAKLTAPMASEGAYFGQSVAIMPGVILVGAPLQDGPHLINGAAYVFEDTGAGWVYTASLQPYSPQRGDRFGLFVAASDGALAVSTSSRAPTGAAFVFERVAGRWTQTSECSGADLAGFEAFGEGLALSGGTMVAGAPADDDRGPLSGSTYVFEVPRASECPRLTLLGDCPGRVECVAEGLVPGTRAALFASFDRRPYVLRSGACSGVALQVHPPFLSGGPVLLGDWDGDGVVRASAFLPASACGRLRLQVLDLGSCLPSNGFEP